MIQPLTTNERLAAALEELDPPVSDKMIRRARRGEYSDFESDSATPKVDLHTELVELGYTDLANRVVAGEFNDTVTEARDFLRSQEGFRILRKIFPAITRDRWREIIPK